MQQHFFNSLSMICQFVVHRCSCTAKKLFAHVNKLLSFSFLSNTTSMVDLSNSDGLFWIRSKNWLNSARNRTHAPNILQLNSVTPIRPQPTNMEEQPAASSCNWRQSNQRSWNFRYQKLCPVCQRKTCNSKTIQIQPTTSHQLQQQNLRCLQTQTTFP